MSITDNIKVGTVETALASAGTKCMWGGSGTSVVGYLSTSSAAVLIGVIITVLGFAFSMYFQRKAHIRQTEEWALRKFVAEREEARKEEIHALQLKQLRRASENYACDQEC